MSENPAGKERREFLRYTHEKPVQYKILNPVTDKAASAKFIDAVSRNLSVSGVLFTSNVLPEIASIVMIDLDTRTCNICREIERHALAVGNKLIGKIVRVEESGGGQYDVGVAFVKKSEKLPKEIRDLLK